MSSESSWIGYGVTQDMIVDLSHYKELNFNVDIKLNQFDINLRDQDCRSYGSPLKRYGEFIIGFQLWKKSGSHQKEDLPENVFYLVLAPCSKYWKSGTSTNTNVKCITQPDEYILRDQFGVIIYHPKMEGVHPILDEGGDWVNYHLDVKKFAEEAFEYYNERYEPYFDLDDYNLVNVGMGWELRGAFDTDIELKNIFLKGKMIGGCSLDAPLQCISYQINNDNFKFRIKNNDASFTIDEVVVRGINGVARPFQLSNLNMYVREGQEKEITVPYSFLQSFVNQPATIQVLIQGKDSSGKEKIISGKLVGVVPLPPCPEIRTISTLFEDNFEDSVADGWEHENDRWQVIDDQGNKVFKGKGHYWADLQQGNNWNDYVFESKVKMLQGSIHINFRKNEEGRYFISFNERQIMLRKQYDSWSVFADIDSYEKHFDKDWHDIKIIVQGNRIKVCVDGELVIDAEDNTLSSGNIAYETLDDSIFYIDDVFVGEI